MSSNERPGTKPDFLARRGGWMLVAWGVVLVALACVFAGEATIASIFAFTGVASVVLGILAARFEGDFELTATGLKGRLLAVAARDDLTLEDKGDEMVRIVERGAGAQRQLLTGAEDRWVGRSNSMRRYLEFEEKAMNWFRANGWHIEPTEHHRGLGDFVARKSGTSRLVEVKARSRISTADIRQTLDRAAAMASVDQVPDFKLVLVVPSGSLTETARQAAIADSPVPFELLQLPEGHE